MFFGRFKLGSDYLFESVFTEFELSPSWVIQTLWKEGPRSMYSNYLTRDSSHHTSRTVLWFEVRDNYWVRWGSHFSIHIAGILTMLWHHLNLYKHIEITYDRFFNKIDALCTLKRISPEQTNLIWTSLNYIWFRFWSKFINFSVGLLN